MILSALHESIKYVSTAEELHAANPGWDVLEVGDSFYQVPADHMESVVNRAQPTAEDLMKARSCCCRCPVSLFQPPHHAVFSARSKHCGETGYL